MIVDYVDNRLCFSVLCLFYKFVGIIYTFVNSVVELLSSSGGVAAKRKWFCTSCESANELVVKKKQRVARVVVSESGTSLSFQPYEELHTINTAFDTTGDTDHDEAEDLSADIPEVSATTSSELPTENTSSEENTQSGEKRGK